MTRGHGELWCGARIWYRVGSCKGGGVEAPPPPSVSLVHSLMDSSSGVGGVGGAVLSCMTPGGMLASPCSTTRDISAWRLAMMAWNLVVRIPHIFSGRNDLLRVLH